ncbi:MAG: type II toxin-antitoxin system HicA family toxin [Candidatus Gracilibacteria bacterium]|nr:type II toxin-antitoxin system HicA family toxin [Candidatus Gracilibacteria bacterium]
MGIFNNVKFKILENFILSLGYIKIKQEGSHIKYDLFGKSLIIPKHNEISRGTLNNIFKIVSFHINIDKKDIEKKFLDFLK